MHSIKQLRRSTLKVGCRLSMQLQLKVGLPRSVAKPISLLLYYRIVYSVKLCHVLFTCKLVNVQGLSENVELFVS